MTDETQSPDTTEQHAARLTRVPRDWAGDVSPLIFTPHGHGRRAYVSQEILDAVDTMRGDGRKTLVIDGSKRSDS